MSPEETKAHILFKQSVQEISPEVAAEMLEGWDANPLMSYADLFRRAIYKPPPLRVFHTAPHSAKQEIQRDGLTPGDGTQNWGDVGQPMGVYVGPEPDLIGKWAFAFDWWDIWAVNIYGLKWDHDTMNPGHWYLPEPVEPFRLTYLQTCTSRRLETS